MRRAGAIVAGVAIVGVAGLGILRPDDGCSGSECGAPTTTVTADPRTTTTAPPSVDESLRQVEDLLDGIDAQIPGSSAAEERDVTG